MDGFLGLKRSVRSHKLIKESGAFAKIGRKKRLPCGSHLIALLSLSRIAILTRLSLALLLSDYEQGVFWEKGERDTAKNSISPFAALCSSRRCVIPTHLLGDSKQTTGAINITGKQDYSTVPLKRFADMSPELSITKNRDHFLLNCPQTSHSATRLSKERISLSGFEVYARRH